MYINWATHTPPPCTDARAERREDEAWQQQMHADSSAVERSRIKLCFSSPQGGSGLSLLQMPGFQLLTSILEPPLIFPINPFFPLKSATGFCCLHPKHPVLPSRGDLSRRFLPHLPPPQYTERDEHQQPCLYSVTPAPGNGWLVSGDSRFHLSQSHALFWALEIGPFDICASEERSYETT